MVEIDLYAIGWKSDCCGAPMITVGGDGSSLDDTCYAVCTACEQPCDAKPIYAEVFTRFRADGWPYCPCCDEDELWTPVVPPLVEGIAGCYRCGWIPRRTTDDTVWTICMGDLRLVLYAKDYEHAVTRLEGWCLQNGVERKGADFLSGLVVAALGGDDTTRPAAGTLWRDREGNTWRLIEFIDGGPWCRLRGVTRFDGVPWSGATWHADWMLDLVRKAVQVHG